MRTSQPAPGRAREVRARQGRARQPRDREDHGHLRAHHRLGGDEDGDVSAGDIILAHSASLEGPCSKGKRKACLSLTGTFGQR